MAEVHWTSTVASIGGIIAVIVLILAILMMLAVIPMSAVTVGALLASLAVARLC